MNSDSEPLAHIKAMTTGELDPSGMSALDFALQEAALGRKVALATLVHIEGASPRLPGAQMAIVEDGRFVGSISTGCLEHIICSDAIATIKHGDGEVIRYGQGSKFIDIALPCGSGMDVLYTPLHDTKLLKETVAGLAKRRACGLSFGTSDIQSADADKSGWDGKIFTRYYTPPLRIVAAGYGIDLIAIGRLAAAVGYQFCAASPDETVLTHCDGAQTVHLTSKTALLNFKIDPWTAFVFLFHDHDWERAILPDLLISPAFYIGAIGSKKTHATRLEALQAIGVGQEALSRINAPIGMIPSTRDASALGISIMASIVDAWPY